MTSDRLRECLRALGWSQRGLAALVGVDERQVRRWAGGDYEVPPAIARWLEKMAVYHEAHPAPQAIIRPPQSSVR